MKIYRYQGKAVFKNKGIEDAYPLTLKINNCIKRIENNKTTISFDMRDSFRRDVYDYNVHIEWLNNDPPRGTYQRLSNISCKDNLLNLIIFDKGEKFNIGGIWVEDGKEYEINIQLDFKEEIDAD